MEGVQDPYLSPDGVWRWNGAAWVPNLAPRPELPGRLQAARTLLYVQAGLTILLGAACALMVATLGTLGAADTGGPKAPVLGLSGLFLVGGVLLGVAQVLAGIHLVRSRWAYRLAVALQVVLLPVGLGVPLVTLVLLLLPESRAALRTAGR